MATGPLLAPRFLRIPTLLWFPSPDPREPVSLWPPQPLPTVKRVTQELGGKSANVILDDADFESAVKEGVQSCFRNTGQSCNAPTRMLIPRSKMAEAVAVAKRAAEEDQKR